MATFGNVDTMQLLLIVILLLCGYIYLFQAVAKRAASRPERDQVPELSSGIQGIRNRFR